MNEEIAELLALAERVSGDPDATISIRCGRQSGEGWLVWTDHPGGEEEPLGGEGTTLAEAVDALTKELRRFAKEKKDELLGAQAALGGATNGD